jgi:hypothetical protein
MLRNGEKELRGAMELRCWRIVAREEGWKILGSERRVIRRVLEGGAGDDNGGSEDRSMESGDRERFWEREGEEPADAGGEDVIFVSVGDKFVWSDSDGLAMLMVAGGIRYQADFPMCGSDRDKFRVSTTVVRVTKTSSTYIWGVKTDPVSARRSTQDE